MLSFMALRMRAIWVLVLSLGLLHCASAQPPESALPREAPPQDRVRPFSIMPGMTGYSTVPGAVSPLPGSPILSAPAMPPEGEPIVAGDPPCDCPPACPWNPCLVVGVRTWFSWANSDRSHGGPDAAGNFFNDQRRLRWRQMPSEVFELNVNTLWFGRLLVINEVGAGAISSGRLRENGVIDPLSESLHPAIDDDLFYANFELGWRFCECEYLIFDGLAGYQYWRETYQAMGGVFVDPPLGEFDAGPYVTERFTWQGFRVGCQGIFTPHPRCVYKARVMFMPFSHFQNRDNHFQDPNVASMLDRAAGGFGVMADVRAAYNLWKGLFVELGYRVWDVSSLDGETLIRFNDGSQSRLPFNGAHTTRHGLLFGFTYHF